MGDLGFQVDLAVRLLISAALGATIGLEREIHGHSAGIRTHLLVSLGSGLFTVLSIFGFPAAEGAPLDPSRVAAQVVSGIGFLGAGAIIKDGFSVRGLTTAATLWATAAIGMAAGAGMPVLAIVGTSIIVFSLWPLNRVAERVHGLVRDAEVLELELSKRGALVEVAHILTEHGVAIQRLTTEEEDERIVVQMRLRRRGGADRHGAIEKIRRLDGVRVVDEESRRND
jgi:putative Mg2+ transporter-C (MgtC) family protein